MKKTIMLFVSVVILLFFSTSFSIDGTVARIGGIAPVVKMVNDSANSSIEDFRGQYLLLTFWSSEDGGSRLKCNQYDSFFKQLAQDDPRQNQLRFAAVNFDKNQPLFQELVRYDNLNPASQYSVNQKDLRFISKSYNLTNGLKSYLIDPAGRIVTVNPTEEQLKKLL